MMGIARFAVRSVFRTFRVHSGPLPLARGGLGWGSLEVAIATSLLTV
ncbi:MAG: hypothetical protein ACRC8Y_09405 [Chroococcales cyanobacterium]